MSIEPIKESYQHAANLGARIVFEMHEIKELLDHIDVLAGQIDYQEITIGKLRATCQRNAATIRRRTAERDALRENSPFSVESST